jgi:hypothetical protein
MVKHQMSEVITFFNSQHNSCSSDEDAFFKKKLRQILPEYFFFNTKNESCSLQVEADYFLALLPYVSSTLLEKVPSNLSFFVVSRYRSDAFRFFFDMIIRWLVPGKRLNAIALFAGDFAIPSVSGDLYSLCEVVVRIDDPEDVKHIQANLSTIETELRLGMESSYYARRILEIKGVNADEKIELVQERITAIIRRLPKYFDYDLISEMQHLFVMCRDEFKALRQSGHLTRIICCLFLFRK